MSQREPWKRTDDETPRQVLQERPPVRYREDRHGRKVRVYACSVCRDTGVASLPPRKRDETTKELLGPSNGGGGKRYAYPCPGCGDTDYGLSHEALTQGNKDRLRRWLAARHEQILADMREDDGKARSVKGALEDGAQRAGVAPGGLPARAMPRLTDFEERESAVQARREAD